MTKKYSKVSYLSCCQRPDYSDVSSCRLCNEIGTTISLCHILHRSVDLRLKAARVHVQSRLIANCLQVHWEHPIFKLFRRGFTLQPPFLLQTLCTPFYKVCIRPCSLAINYVHCFTFLSFVAPLFVGFTISLLKKDYCDTIKYRDYCLIHYRDSRKAPLLSPNLVQHSEVKESIVTVCNIWHLTKSSMKSMVPVWDYIRLRRRADGKGKPLTNE